jgi:hypothetical protein
MTVASLDRARPSTRWESGAVKDPSCPLCGAVTTDIFGKGCDPAYARCRVCALVFLAPAARLGPEAELAHYRTHRNDPADPRYRAFLSRLIDPLLPHLRPGMSALDYGSGPGPAIRPMLAAHGIQVTDWDPFFAPDEAALRRTYDLVTCSETAEHFFEPGREFDRLDGLLNPGGWLGLMTEPLTNEVDFATWWYRRDPTHVCFYGTRTFAWIADRFAWDMEIAGRTVVLFRKSGQDDRT